MAHAILEASAQKQSSTTRAEKAPDQSVLRTAAETAGRAHSVQIVAIHSRKTEKVRLKGSTLERRSSAAGAGSCAPSTDHDRRQRVASLALPRLTTFQEGNSPAARRERRSQSVSARDAIRLYPKSMQKGGRR